MPPTRLPCAYISSTGPLIPPPQVKDATAIVSLARGDKANAQNMQMLYDINNALNRAAKDPDVKCIILRADGKHFSSGHDLADQSGTLGETWPLIGTHANFDPAHTVVPKWSKARGSTFVEGWFNREKEIFKDMCERWRNIPKPTIAAVQGKCIAGGLMLIWPMDVIVAADSATFQDLTVAMGVCGVEYFAHTFELGPRKAKELLFTADSINADEARDLGMVNTVVPADQLDVYCSEMAAKITAKPMFALQMAKEAVNQQQDAMGRKQGMDAVFSLHHLCHAYAVQQFGIPIDPRGSFTPTKKSRL